MEIKQLEDLAKYLQDEGYIEVSRKLQDTDLISFEIELGMKVVEIFGGLPGIEIYTDPKLEGNGFGEAKEFPLHGKDKSSMGYREIVDTLIKI